MSAEYNFKFKLNADVPRFDLDFTAGYIGAVKVLGIPVAASPTQEQINAAVAAYIEEHPGSAFGISEEVKQALLQIANHTMYDDGNAAQYIEALRSALYPPADLVSISAVYTQSGTVYDDTSLDSLKNDLVVTALYSDASTEVVPSTSYTLSGTLTTGTSTVTVSYGGKTTTFTVEVSGSGLLYNWDYTQSLVDTVNGVETELTNMTRTSAGLVFSASNQHALVGSEVMAYDRTIEVDFTDVSYSAGNYTAILWHLWNGTDDPQDGYYSSFGFRYGSSSSDRKLGCITTATANWGYASPTVTRTAWDGKTGTLAMTVSSTGKYKFFLDGEDLGVVRSGNDMYINGEAKIKAMTLGMHSNGSYVSFYNWTVKAVRIYNGVRYGE